MGNEGAGTGAGEDFSLSGDQQVRPDQAAPVRGGEGRKVRRKRSLGTHVISAGPVSVWFEGGAIKMRRRRSRVVETLSIDEAWHVAVGQKELRFQ